jgi:hypothetical protein
MHPTALSTTRPELRLDNARPFVYPAESNAVFSPAATEGPRTPSGQCAGQFGPRGRCASRLLATGSTGVR